MTSPTVSIVIVSQDRPKALRRCLIAVAQLKYVAFEVVVVADTPSCTALRMLPEAAYAKVVAFDRSNISAARNTGIDQAAGEIVAFVDDDAVPEPTWLTYLVAPFSDPAVMASGGFVRGRNGISFQSRGQTVDRTGQTRPLQLDPEVATILTPTPNRAIKTEGTNMAVRRDVLVDLGGFDPRFRFYLDETDLNMRLADRGMATALVPRAQVHHGFAASARRRGDRVPTDLTQIGASWAVFLAKHCNPGDHDAVWRRIQAEERRRALSHLVTGGLEPRDVRHLMQGLEQGFRSGNRRKSEDAPIGDTPKEVFRAYPTQPDAPSLLVSGRRWSRSRLARKARDLRASGAVVTVICLSPSALFHHVWFNPDGVWYQTGGLFGKSDRSQPSFSLWSFKARVRYEAERLTIQRGFGVL